MTLTWMGKHYYLNYFNYSCLIATAVMNFHLFFLNIFKWIWKFQRILKKFYENFFFRLIKEFFTLFWPTYTQLPCVYFQLITVLKSTLKNENQNLCFRGVLKNAPFKKCIIVPEEICYSSIVLKNKWSQHSNIFIPNY